MKLILLPFTLIWRIWFYITIAIAILVLLPFIYITSLTSGRYRQFFIFARIWAWIVLILSGLWPRSTWHEKPDKKGVYIICANHTSMMDIMMTLALFPNCFLFIGKKELTKLPIFGYFYKKTNILVDRNSLSSKKDVMRRAAAKIEQGIGLCIYPEGGVPKAEIILAPFKNGAFKLASEKGIPIVPVSYPDNKKHLPYNFFKGYPGICRAIVHPFIVPEENSDIEMFRLKEECYNTLYQSLLSFEAEGTPGVLSS